MKIQFITERFTSKIKILFSLFLIFSSWFTLQAQGLYGNDFTENENYTSILRYQGKIGNDLIFYDTKGLAVYLQYRIDRWDFAAEEKISDLRPGAEYKIDWTFKGYREEVDGNFQGITQESQTSSRIRQIPNVPTGVYIGHKATLPQKIFL